MANLPPPPLQAWNSLPRPWAQWFMLLWNRVGGSNAVSIDELQIMAMEDAGIEEAKATLLQLADEMAQMPIPAQQSAEDNLAARFELAPSDEPQDGRLEALAAEVAALRALVESLAQGTTA